MKIRDVEKRHKTDFGVNKDMELSTYLEREGLKSLARALKRSETSKYVKRNFSKAIKKLK